MRKAFDVWNGEVILVKITSFFVKIQKEVVRIVISILSSERDVFERIFEKFPKNS